MVGVSLFECPVLNGLMKEGILPFTYLSTPSPIHAFMHPFTRLPTHPSIHISPIHPSISFHPIIPQ